MKLNIRLGAYIIFSITELYAEYNHPNKREQNKIILGKIRKLFSSLDISYYEDTDIYGIFKRRAIPYYYELFRDKIISKEYPLKKL